MMHLHRTLPAAHPVAWIALLISLPACLFSQIPPGGGMNATQFNIGHFYGKVVDDATGKGLGYASVQLTGMRFDSVTKAMQPILIAGQLTAENGEFSLENLPIRGQFTLKVSYLGYGEVEQKVSFVSPDKPGAGRPILFP